MSLYIPKLGLRPVHRKMLLEALAEELTPDVIHFSSKAASIKTEVSRDSSTAIVLHLEDRTTIRTKVLIGCDGVQSVVAQWLGLAAPINSGRSAVRGLAIYPEGHGLKNGANQFISYGKRGGIVPLNDKEIYWFIAFSTQPRERDTGKDFTRDHSLILREVTENLPKEFPEAYLDVVRHSDPSSLTWAPLLIRTPWAVIAGPNHKGMHPMTPDLGQGGCAALEDAIVLARNIGCCLSSEGRMFSQRIVEDGMENYVKERKWRVAGLIAGSYLSTTRWVWALGVGYQVH